MASGALAAYFGPKQRMGKMGFVQLDQRWPGVVAMAGYAVRLGQGLVKGNMAKARSEWGMFGGTPADVGNLMASYAAFCHGPAQGRMAGKTIPANCGMRRDQWAGGEHGLRHGKGQSQQ